MKKSLFFGLVAVLGLIGCSRNQEIDVPDANLSLFARTESPADTKTVVEEGVHVYWEPGDEIAVFLGDESAKFTTDIKATSGTATFKGTFGDTTWPEDLDLWAVYPFSEDATFDGETITTTLPSEQIAREGSFGKDMNLSIAHSSSTSLQFYNVGGGIRFSVLEDGIKKVMFEGLSGEIISGKVKIGLDEDGLPVVKEVSGGSQFITLLPPSGKETFEKDTWYYIVAIPGSLEGGYKLRFYKDSDYARKVSEKKVEIKRSVFGSLEKADEGIEYEATTTKFPETEEEWKESIGITNGIIQSWDKLLKTVRNAYDTERLANQLSRTDNVISVEKGDSTIIVRQKDGVELHFLLETYDSLYYNRGANPSIQESIYDSVKRQFNAKSYTHNEHKQALILAPFYWAWLETEPINAYKSALIDAGFQEGNIRVWKNWEAGYRSFYGSVLSEFDVILIHTHGGHSESIGTFLVSATKYDEQLIDTYLSDKQNQGYVLCIGNVDDFGIWNETTTPYVAMNSSFLQDASFNNSWIHLSGCETMKYLDLADAFLEKGAGLVTGYNRKVLSLEAEPLTKQFLEDMSLGFSSEEAAHRINKQWFCQKVNENYDLYFLADPHPKDLKVTPSGNYRLLSWKQDQTAGTYSFDLYINDYKWYTTSSFEYKYYHETPGEYNWYVVANLIMNDEIVASYRTDGEPFTIEAAPLTTNVIYYTSTDAKIVSPTNPDAFGANIVSNEYINGKGVLTFDANISSCSSNAFSESGTLSSIIIPKGVTSIGYNAFGACVKLESISLPDDLIIIEAHAFEQCLNLTDVVIPESVTNISNRAFQFCSNLTCLTIPKNVIRIGIDAFIATESLKSISVSPENTIYDSRNNCNAIIETQTNTLIVGCQKTVIPKSVTSIFDSAFYGCKELTGITIPENVVSIGNKAFGHCYSLTEITLPESIRSIGLEAFRACPLTKMVVLSVSPPTIGTNILYDSDCLIYVPASSLQAYKTADGWSNYADRIRAIGSEAPSVSFSPTTCNFGNVNIGESSRIVFTFTNSGDAMLDVTVESCPDDFVTTPKVGNSFSVRANESRTGFSITFYPEKAKYYSGTVVLSTNDPNNPKIYIPVSGTGVSAQSSEPLISITPDSYDFGSVAVGQYSRSSITITNTGTADLVINTIKLVDGNQGFDLGSSAEPGTISPGGSMSFGIRFQPRSKGDASDQVLIKSNASNYSYNLVYLSGTGI